MNKLNFKSWLEATTDVEDDQLIQNDPNVSVAAKKAQLAAADAVNRGKNPIKAAQMAVIQSKVPPNKLGTVMPQNMLVNKNDQ